MENSIEITPSNFWGIVQQNILDGLLPGQVRDKLLKDLDWLKEVLDYVSRYLTDFIPCNFSLGRYPTIYVCEPYFSRYNLFDPEQKYNDEKLLCCDFPEYKDIFTSVRVCS